MIISTQMVLYAVEEHEDKTEPWRIGKGDERDIATPRVERKGYV